MPVGYILSAIHVESNKIDFTVSEFFYVIWGSIERDAKFFKDFVHFWRQLTLKRWCQNHAIGEKVCVSKYVIRVLGCRVEFDNAAIVDGTSPHVLEPTYAVASERYVDLTRFYDVDAAKARRAEIVALSDEYRAHYRSAYRILRAMGEVESERRVAMHAQMDFSKLRRRTDGILARELRGEGGGSGRVDRAFLGGVTHRGEICRFDTVEALCPRIYAIIDSAGLGNEMLETVVQAAQAKHFDIIACPNPDRPRELHHVLIPEKGLAFITTNARNPYDGKPYRRLRLDAMAEEKLTRAQKAKLRFTRRVEASLLDEAVGALSNAKKAHDALESAYHPCVDFEHSQS